METSRWIILRHDKDLGIRLVEAFDVEFNPLPGLEKALAHAETNRLEGPFTALVIGPDGRTVSLHEIHAGITTTFQQLV